MATAAAAACVGAACALSAPWLATFFHLSAPALDLAASLVDLLCAGVFAPWLRHAPGTVLEVLSRLLGMLLAAVGVQVFLTGLTLLGVLPGH